MTSSHRGIIHGKSPFAAALLLLVFAFDYPIEPRAEAYTAATKKKQSKVVFNEVNRAGGIYGRKIDYVGCIDGGDLAPGDRHLSVEQQGGRLRTATRRTPRVHHQRPAVDVLFHSLAKVRGVPIVGILLTGMGRDGADGMVALRRAGQPTIAEDSRSCVVFGMPRAAIQLGAASEVLPASQIAERLVNLIYAPTTQPGRGVL